MRARRIEARKSRIFVEEYAICAFDFFFALVYTEFMDTKLILREVLPEDYARLSTLASRLWHAAYDDIPEIGSAQVGYMLEKFQSVPALTEQVSAHGYTYYFVEYGGKIAGYTGVKEEEDALFLSKLYLDPAFIGKGIGQKTLACVKMIAVSSRLARIYLTVNKHNKRAIAAYERFGFVRTEEAASDIGGGFVMDDYIYTYDL